MSSALRQQVGRAITAMGMRPAFEDSRAKAQAARKLLRDVRNLFEGARRYASGGQVSLDAYYALLNLFCATRGISNDLMHALVAASRPRYAVRPVGVLGTLDAAEVERIGSRLRRDGYYVFPRLLPPAEVKKLVDFSLRTPCTPKTGKPEPGPGALFERDKPRHAAYQFDERLLWRSSDIEALAMDDSLLAVAQEYLGCAPVLDMIAMWWSTSLYHKPLSEAAQLYHFDMDRIRWLKFFIYLTDVGPDTGPHCFVAGTHRSRTQPSELLSLGYARIDEATIRSHYPADAIRELTGPAGTIAAVDTRGFHRGKELLKGDRLILQLEFADCLFGGDFLPIPPPRSTALQERMGLFPAVYPPAKFPA